METVFDHNPSDEELLILFKHPWNIELHRNILNSHDGNMAEIARLLYLRGEKDRSNEYLERIEDYWFRYASMLHPVDDV